LENPVLCNLFWLILTITPKIVAWGQDFLIKTRHIWKKLIWQCAQLNLRISQANWYLKKGIFSIIHKISVSTHKFQFAPKVTES
jgi:hypothetical protein